MSANSKVTVSGAYPPAIAIVLTLGWAGAGAAPAIAQDDKEGADPLDTVVITATRVPTLIRDEPLRVEAVPADEIEENVTEQPGNLTALLNELPSGRVRSTAPGLGGVGLQLRGLSRVSGTVYASDIDPSMVRATIDRAAQAAVRNVVVETRDFVSDGCGRPDASVSFVMLFNIKGIAPTGLFAAFGPL